MASLHRRCQREPDAKPQWLLIEFRDAVCSEDPWEHKEYMAKVWMGHLLTHPAVKLNLSMLMILNEVLITSQTPMTQPWSDGWNIFNFLLMTLRLMRLLQVSRLVKGPARMLQAILKVIPDLCNITFILFISMLIFLVLGIILLGKSVLAHFGDLGKALYSLSTCITLDGWLDIYEAFHEEGQTLKMMAAIYFIIFIMSEAFICANLLVAVMTSRLWESLFTHTKEEQREQEPSLEESQNQLNGGVANTDPQLSPRVMGDRVSMNISQDLFTYSELGKVNKSILHEVQCLLESSKQNIREYKQICEELNVIGKKVRAIEFNVVQEHELIQQKLFYTTFLDSPYPSEVTLTMCGDIISTLSKLERAHLVHPKDMWWVADGQDWGQRVAGWVKWCE
ncbi:PREDICTED: cation channel sperm-associated protein 4-like [Nipponia nippon]|uniref:cation channel sperm-associated protein 4-like n=1 Tax=Nipponia nippon TaxID=128390 RepID=UPI000511618F|nr:PREDICTED: cation channel sperm-associated protein 4-like [Nipponia nippon]